MLKTKFCELFGIEYPIVSAGMGGVALRLAR
jgi:NAD(P)H-dependent flavin oxidoreductase YrpB (nitropropane dioxygenase family)